MFSWKTKCRIESAKARIKLIGVPVKVTYNGKPECAEARAWRLGK